jgi:hypothetical protein
VFADEVAFPEEDMLLPDRRLATVQPMRSRALFDYVNELMRQKVLSGYWRHAENELHVADYKLYNSFPVYTALDGKPLDSAFDAYRYLVGVGGGQAVLAFEIMTSPEMVAGRAASGWRVVSHRTPEQLQGTWHHGAWSFSGMGSQYITQGPRILDWACRYGGTVNGLWWRPDRWEYRLHLRVASDAGLESVAIHEGDRGTFRKWRPGGASEFERELVLCNSHQQAFFLEVTDREGRRAISMAYWPRNLLLEEFMCSDRCNFLGNARLRTRQGSQVWTQVSFKGNMGITPSKGLLDLSVEPAVTLTMNAPTLPIDGRPMGFPSPRLVFGTEIPGEHARLFAYPHTYMVGPEIAIGQADVRFAYDPAEKDAKETRLGHAYAAPQEGYGNAWGSWHRLVPTRHVEGVVRTYACNWLPGEFRIGWHETDLRVKQDVENVSENGLRVMYAGSGGWTLYRGAQVLASVGGEETVEPFDGGTYAVLPHQGGSVVLFPLRDGLRIQYRRDGSLTLWLPVENGRVAAGARLHVIVGFAGAGGGTGAERLREFAEAFGVSSPGRTRYAPEVLRGTETRRQGVWSATAADGAFRARIPRANVPGYVPLRVAGLNDNWSVVLLDRERQGPNHRGLAIRDGVSYAQLDVALAGMDVFVGHPVRAGEESLKILAAWAENGRWFVEAHNAGDAPIATRVFSDPDWPLFKLDENVRLAPGESLTWLLDAAPLRSGVD